MKLFNLNERFGKQKVEELMADVKSILILLLHGASMEKNSGQLAYIPPLGPLKVVVDSTATPLNVSCVINSVVSKIRYQGIRTL